MIITLILAASAAQSAGKMVGPVPRNDPAEWVTTDDYASAGATEDGPSQVAPGTVRTSSTIQGPVGYRLELDATGKIIGCDAKSGSRDALSMELKTCELVKRRARFAPALDIEGNPVAGVYSSRAYWYTAGRTSFIANLPPESGDLTFGLQSMPAGLSSPTNVRVHVLVAADGTAEACIVAPTDPAAKGSSDSDAQAQAKRTLGESACSQALSAFTGKLKPAMEKKQPVRSVQTAIVRFATLTAAPGK